MSIFLIVGAAALAEGATETAMNCVNKAKDILTHKAFKHEQRARRKRRERREFI